MTLDDLKSIMPRMAANPNTATALFPHLQAALTEAQITTPARIAAFLGQVAVESGQFKYTEEIWGPTSQQLRYDPPSTLASKLGNIHPGDGYRYRGRGQIMLTGLDNYRKCGHDLGLDLVNNPDLASKPEASYRVTCWYWTTHHLNTLADTGDFLALTKAINGGTIGLEQRTAFWEKAKQVLGA